MFSHQLALFGRLVRPRAGGGASRMKTLTRYIGREVVAAILLIFGRAGHRCSRSST